MRIVKETSTMHFLASFREIVEINSKVILKLSILMDSKKKWDSALLGKEVTILSYFTSLRSWV